MLINVAMQTVLYTLFTTFQTGIGIWDSIWCSHTLHVVSVSVPDPHSQSSTAICGRPRGERASRAHSLPDSEVNIQLWVPRKLPLKTCTVNIITLRKGLVRQSHNVSACMSWYQYFPTLNASKTALGDRSCMFYSTMNNCYSMYCWNIIFLNKFIFMNLRHMWISRAFIITAAIDLYLFLDHRWSRPGKKFPDILL